MILQNWSASPDVQIKNDADEILEIRSRELKYIGANRYANISNEIYKGYVALEHYFEEISKYKEEN